MVAASAGGRDTGQTDGQQHDEQQQAGTRAHRDLPTPSAAWRQSGPTPATYPDTSQGKPWAPCQARLPGVPRRPVSYQRHNGKPCPTNDQQSPAAQPPGGLVVCAGPTAVSLPRGDAARPASVAWGPSAPSPSVRCGPDRPAAGTSIRRSFLHRFEIVTKNTTGRSPVSRLSAAIQHVALRSRRLASPLLEQG